MAAKSYEAAYRRAFGDRLINLLSHATTEEEIKDLYVDWAGTYDKDLITAGLVYHQHQAECFDAAIKQVFQDKPKDKIKILDIGAGTGLIGVELKKLGYTDLQALDITQEMLNEAKKKNVYNKFICAPLRDQRIPEIETGEFDASICCGTLVAGHVKPNAFVEMIRMVKIGGLIHFNIRSGDLDDYVYQQKMLELENAGRWVNVLKTTAPHFDRDDLPRESLVFVYKVLKN